MASSNCEVCEREHDGSYGSGRFCSSRCARGFSTRSKRAEINERVSRKLSGDSRCAWNKGQQFVDREIRECQICKTEFQVLTTSTRKFCGRRCQLRDVFGPKSREWRCRQYQNGRKVSGGKTKWCDYRGLRVQGTYELRMCQILDAWSELEWIGNWEYTSDRIPYLWEDGTEHTYLLDFKVERLDGTVVYFEVKGFTREHDQLKWDATRELGLELRVWFKQDLEIAELLLCP